MKSVLITTTAIVSLAGTAFADVASLDANGDGALSMSELEVAYPRLTEKIFKAIDANGDGVVDVAEMSVAEESGILTAS